MSNRVFKKLYGDKNPSFPINAQSDSDEDSPGISNCTSSNKLAKNRFELLNDVATHSPSDTEAKEDDDREQDSSNKAEGAELDTPTIEAKQKLEKQDSVQSTDSLKRKKKRKKKKLKSQKSQEDALENGEEDLELMVQEVNNILGNPNEASYSKQPVDAPEKPLLGMEHRFLNPYNEMKRLFGARVVQSDQPKKRGRGRNHIKSTFLVPSHQNYSQLGKSGISMTHLETKNGVLYFTFEHSKPYQAIQNEFLSAVERSESDTIFSLVNLQPTNMDVLIQFSDICKMADDSKLAAELIERALYIAEMSFHPLFNLTQGNCRLDYRRSENRSFFIALFKHIFYVGQRGCYRTALELCKLLLSLDPEGDPLGVVLMMDYYALQSSQHEYLIRFFQELDSTRNLHQLPNFAFSIPLALLHLGMEKSDESLISQANTKLQDSLIMFPSLLSQLLSKCSVEPDPRVSKHPFFGLKSQLSNSMCLDYLISLYISRCSSLWKDPVNMTFLESSVHQALDRVDKNDPFVSECEEKRKIRYQGFARNILRHIILSNFKDNVPLEVTSGPVYGFDPLPPTDAIITYQRAPRHRDTQDTGLLNMFFRSLAPNFNPNQPESNDTPIGGAVGGIGEPNDLRRSLTSLLDAMRDLLSNIQMNDGDVESDVEGE